MDHSNILPLVCLQEYGIEPSVIVGAVQSDSAPASRNVPVCNGNNKYAEKMVPGYTGVLCLSFLHRCAVLNPLTQACFVCPSCTDDVFILLIQVCCVYPSSTGVLGLSLLYRCAVFILLIQVCCVHPSYAGLLCYYLFYRCAVFIHLIQVCCVYPSYTGVLCLCPSLSWCTWSSGKAPILRVEDTGVEPNFPWSNHITDLKLGLLVAPQTQTQTDTQTQTPKHAHTHTHTQIHRHSHSH